MKQFVVIFFTAVVTGIGAISYSWAAWTTETLISVDKKTEVIATEISYIKKVDELKIDGEKYLIMREDDIVGIVQ